MNAKKKNAITGKLFIARMAIATRTNDFRNAQDAQNR
jgi:hypothetical protein